MTDARDEISSALDRSAVALIQEARQRVAKAARIIRSSTEGAASRAQLRTLDACYERLAMTESDLEGMFPTGG